MIDDIFASQNVQLVFASVAWVCLMLAFWTYLYRSGRRDD